MTRQVKWWQTLNKSCSYDTKENYQITRWYEDQAWIDERNLNVEIDQRLPKDILIEDLIKDLIWRIS